MHVHTNKSDTEIHMQTFIDTWRLNWKSQYLTYEFHACHDIYIEVLPQRTEYICTASVVLISFLYYTD